MKERIQRKGGTYEKSKMVPAGALVTEVTLVYVYIFGGRKRIELISEKGLSMIYCKKKKTKKNLPD